MIKHILAIAGGKGGVGKSAVAVNLALALQKIGARVGLLDADLYGPSVRHMLPEERLPAQSLENSNKILPAFARGIVYVSIAFFRREGEASIVRAPIANSAITQFIEAVEWGDLDYLIIDFPPGTGDIQLTLAQHARLSGAFLVTLPQALSKIDVLKAAQLFEQGNVPILGIIENMQGFFPGNAGIFLSRELGVPLVAQIPYDALLCECADRGLDLFSENPDSQAAKAFADLALKMVKLLAPYVDAGTAIGQDVDLALIDPKTLRVEWKDGLIREITCADLQVSCPCIQCKENPKNIDLDVQADSVALIGKYAFMLHFRSGCSRGIYPFSMLYSWRKQG